MSVKCLVTDLDNTLWDGALIEAGLEGVKPYADRIDVLRELDSRGILLSIATRNNIGQAIEALKKFSIDDLFLVPQINWGPKYSSLKMIANTLELSLSSFAFVDNEDAELEEVRRKLPGVTVINATDYLSIPSMKDFSGGTTEESKNRRALYQGLLKEREIRESNPLGPDAFVPGLETRVDIWAIKREDHERAIELMERAHRLNFSGNTYDARAFQKVLKNPQKAVYMVRVSNEVTDYGRSGACIVDRQVKHSWYIEDLVFSCRVAGKGVERATLAYLIQEARNCRAGKLTLLYRHTEDNAHLPLTIGSFDFTERKGDGGTTEYEFNTAQATPELKNIIVDLPKRIRLGDRKEYLDFIGRLPKDLQQRLKQYEDEQWLWERWKEIRHIRNSIIEQSSNESLSERLAQNFWLYYTNLDFVNMQAKACGKYARPIQLRKDVADYLVRSPETGLLAFAFLWRQLPASSFKEKNVFDALEKNPDVDIFSELLYCPLFYDDEGFHQSTELVLHDSGNLANALMVGKMALVEYVQALVRHPDAGLLRDARVIEAIRKSDYPPGMVSLAEHLGYADCILDMTGPKLDTKAYIKGTLSFFPFSIDESSLQRAIYYSMGGCGGGIQRHESVQKIAHLGSQHTLALFPGKAEFGDLKNQYFMSSYMPGCIGYANFVEAGDGLVIIKNESVWEAPNPFEKWLTVERSMYRRVKDIHLSGRMRHRFSSCPETLFWAFHEYAAQHGKSWVGIFPSSYWLKESRLTRQSRDLAAQDAIKINRAYNKYRDEDWQVAYKYSHAKVLSKRAADKHYDLLAAQVPGATQAPYDHNGAEVLIWKVPLQTKTPLTGTLERKEAQETLLG